MAKSRGLGRGLDSLISTKTAGAKTTSAAIEVASQTSGKEEKISISLISPNKEQPRKNFDEEALKELSESIKQHGVISPLILVKKDKGYEIIAGERRYRAAKMAGLKEVPAIVREYSEEKASEIAIIENIQREDLNAIEEAKAYEKLINDYGLKQEDLAKRMSKSRASITNHLRLLKLSDKIQKLVIDGKISEGHARALLSTTSETKREEVAERIVKEKLSVREVEQLLKERTNVRKNKPQTRRALEGEEFYEKLEQDLKETLGTKVSVKRKGEEKGTIQIDYYSIEDLERLTGIFKKGGRAR